ncbi:hypothetical protein TorRG33x02_321730 [Trema orientale]|uniref:Uncharacterized protein n=1 Tax=Trema orientale TaxID=63057 RepID=A0A2P5BGL4_TREOI|nr:hypothetical protein TorRG33x02_321730 [Trema orientale]
MIYGELGKEESALILVFGTRALWRFKRSEILKREKTFQRKWHLDTIYWHSGASSGSKQKVDSKSDAPTPRYGNSVHDFTLMTFDLVFVVATS